MTGLQRYSDNKKAGSTMLEPALDVSLANLSNIDCFTGTSQSLS